MSASSQILTPQRLKRLARWQLPVILTAALIGLSGEALGLSREVSLAAAVSWQLLFAAWMLRRGRSRRAS